MDQHIPQNGDLEDPWLLVERNLLATRHVTREGFVAQVRGIYVRAVEMRDQNWIKELQRACMELALSEQDAYFNFPNPYGSNYTQASKRTNSSVTKCEGMYRGPVHQEGLDTPFLSTDTANRQLSRAQMAVTGVPVYIPNDSQKTSRTVQVTESVLHQAMPSMTNVPSTPWIVAPRMVVSTASSQPQFPFCNPMQPRTVTAASTERPAHVEYSPQMNERVQPRKREPSCSRPSSSPKEPMQRSPFWSPSNSMPTIRAGRESNISHRTNLHRQMSLSRECLSTERYAPAHYSPEMNSPRKREHSHSRASSNSEEPRRRTPSWTSSDSIPRSMPDEPRQRSPSCSPEMLRGSEREPSTHQRSGSLCVNSYSGSLNRSYSTVQAEYSPEMNRLRRRERSCSRARSSSEEPRRWNPSWSPSYKRGKRKARVHKWTGPNNNMSPSRESWCSSPLTAHAEYSPEMNQMNNIPREGSSSRSDCFEEPRQSNPPWSPSQEIPLSMPEDPQKRNPSWSHEIFQRGGREISDRSRTDPPPYRSPRRDIRSRSPSWSQEIFQMGGREITDKRRYGSPPHRSPRRDFHSRSPSWSPEIFRRGRREMSDKRRNGSSSHRSPGRDIQSRSPSRSQEIFRRGRREISEKQRTDSPPYRPPRTDIRRRCLSPEIFWRGERKITDKHRTDSPPYRSPRTDIRSRNPSWSPEIFRRGGRAISDKPRTDSPPYRSPRTDIRSRSPSWSPEILQRGGREVSVHQRNNSPLKRSQISQSILMRGHGREFHQGDRQAIHRTEKIKDSGRKRHKKETVPITNPPQKKPKKARMICPMTGCKTEVHKLKKHLKRVHIPALFHDNETPAELVNSQFHSLRQHALEMITHYLLGTSGDIQRLVKIVSYAPFDCQEISATTQQAMKALARVSGWKVPCKFSIKPINSPAALIHWRPVSYLMNYLSRDQSQEMFRLFGERWGIPEESKKLCPRLNPERRRKKRRRQDHIETGRSVRRKLSS